MSKLIVKGIAVALFAFYVTAFNYGGCGCDNPIDKRIALKNCDFKLKNVDIEKIDLLGFALDLVFDVDVNNPNEIEVVIDKFDIELALNDNPVGKGSSPNKISIAAKENKSVPLRTKIEFRGTYKAIKSIIKDKEFDYLLKCTVYAGEIPFSFELRKDEPLFSIKFDSWLGYKATEALEAEYGGVSKDTALDNRINAIGKKLAPFTKYGEDITYQFRVLKTKQVNAFALPGGPVYATAGLMEMTDNDHELASVLGHELGHINARHSINSMKLTLGLSVIESVFRSYLKESEKLNLSKDELKNIEIINNALIGLALLGYSRENEYEADAIGIKYAANADYNPYGMVSFMTKIKEMGGKDPGMFKKFISTHPSNKKRISEMNEIIARDYPQFKPLTENK